MDRGGGDDETLGEWTAKFRFILIFGIIGVLLAGGKAVSFTVWGRIPLLRHLYVPPAVLAGCFGCVLYHILCAMSTEKLISSIDKGVTEVIINLINMCFAGLALGFGATKSYVPHTRAIVTSIFHESLPMLIYSQTLIWGQSCVALMTAGLFSMGNSQVSPYLGALVTLGMETGRDVNAHSTAIAVGEPLAHDVVRLADTVGLIISLVMGVAIMTWQSIAPMVSSTGGRVRPNTPELAVAAARRGRHREHFGRRGARGSVPTQIELELRQRREAATNPPRTPLSPALSTGDLLSFGGGDSDIGEDRAARSASPSRHAKAVVAGVGAAGNQSPGSAITQSLLEDGLSSEADNDQSVGLGAHISLMATSVLFAWLVDLLVRLSEESTPFLSKHHVISGFRLFKLSMCAALALICAIRRLTLLQFKAEWFFRLSGISLDIMTVAAVGSIDIKAAPTNQGPAFAAVILACCAWNVFMFFVLGPRMFPNHWVLRGGVLLADAMGHSWIGLLTLRALDPRLATPVPLAYAYKMMLFFVPASGGKNSLVVAAIDKLGSVGAFFLCGLMLSFWLWVFESRVKKRMPQHQTGRVGRTGRKKERSDSSADAVPFLSDQLEGVEGGSSLTSPETRRRSVQGHPSDGGKGFDKSPGGGGVYNPPTLVGESEILSAVRVRQLAGSLPACERSREWQLLYSSGRDGSSLSTLLWKCSRSKRNAILIVVEDSWGYVFGGYAQVVLQNSTSYYGDGNSFVFAFHPNGYRSWNWTGQNNYVILSNEQTLAMGGGGGFAFQLDDEVDQGVSGPSTTFGCPRLSSNEFFRVVSVECWTFGRPQ